MRGIRRTFPQHHWEKQEVKNEHNLRSILASADESLVLRPIINKKPRGDIEDTFSQHTIELCVITDPVLFQKVKVSQWKIKNNIQCLKIICIAYNCNFPKPFLSLFSN